MSLTGYDDADNISMPGEETHVRWSDEHLTEFYRQFRQHAAKLELHMDREEAQLSKLLGAFPNRDPTEHRKYHESLLEAADAQRKFWLDLRLDIAKRSIWAVLTIAVVLIGWALVEKLKNSVGAP